MTPHTLLIGGLICSALVTWLAEDWPLMRSVGLAGFALNLALLVTLP